MSDSEDESSGEESPVTSEWLEAILASYHQQELHHNRDGGGDDAEEDGVELSVSIGEFSVGPGCDAGECVLSDILAVKVQYRVSPGTPDPRTLNLIVKLLPHDPFSRFFVTEAQFDLREIKFYTQVSSVVLESYPEGGRHSDLKKKLLLYHLYHKYQTSIHLITTCKRKKGCPRISLHNNSGSICYLHTLNLQ